MVLRIAKWLGIGLATLIGGVVAVGVAARFCDGPLGPFPGGAMSGTSVSEPVSDWSFLAARDTVELQVSPDAPRSVTTAIIVHEAEAFIPCRLPKRKTWPRLATSDPRVTLRVEGKLHFRLDPA